MRIEERIPRGGLTKDIWVLSEKGGDIEPLANAQSVTTS